MTVTGPGTVPDSPYKGLVPYSEEDAPFFFGREAEQEIIAANLQAYRLTLLYGPSGVGKSSVLRAGVAHHLRQASRRGVAVAAGRPEYVVVVFSSWRDDPVIRLTERIRASMAAVMPEAADADVSASMSDTLSRWTMQYDTDLLIILDQFEEYFLYHADDPGEVALRLQAEAPGDDRRMAEVRHGFAHEFPRAITRQDLRVNFLVSIRDDALAKLDRFKGRIPTLFDNYLRIDHLGREAASEAIVRPVEQFNRLSHAAPMAIEPALREAVLDQLGTGHIALTRGGRDESAIGAASEQTGDRIETPYLQVVMMRLWKEEKEAGSNILRLQTLTRLGGAERIVRTHLDAVMSTLTPGERHVAARAFRYLVTPSGAKIAHTLNDLSEYSGIPRAQLEPVAQKLSSGELRIVRPVAPPSGQPQVARYEIFHDVLAASIADWRGRIEAEWRAQIDTVLQPLHRWAWSLSTRYLLSSLAIALPLLDLIMLDPDTRVRSTPVWILAAVAFSGFLLMAFTAGASLRRYCTLVTAVRMGFAWRTVADVLADRRSTIGDLVAGTGQYDQITADVRDRVRARRRLQAGLALLGAMAPAAGLVAVVALGAQELIEPMAAPGIILIPSVVLLGGVVVIRILNARELPRARRHKRARGTSRERASSRDSLERLAPGEPSPSMLRRARAAVWGWGLTASLLPFATGLAAVPIMVVGLVGPSLVRSATTGELVVDDIMRIRQAATRLASDPTISPLAAGRAYYALMEMGRSEPRGGDEHPVPRFIAAPSFPADKDNPFGESLTDVFDTLLTRTAGAFTESQRVFLENIASFEGFTETSLVARAAEVDYLGARLVPNHSLNGWGVPVRNLSQNLPRAYLAKAALEVLNGRHAQAEMTLKEMISFAVVMTDEAHSLLELLVAGTILKNGLKALEQLYDVTGDAAGARVIRRERETADELRSRLYYARAVSPSTDTLADFRRKMLMTAVDSARSRGERWEALVIAGVLPCSNAQEVVFGPSEALHAAFERAQSTLVRFPSERQLLRNTRSVVLTGALPEDVDSSLLARLGSLSGKLFQSDRIGLCPAVASLFSSLF